MKKQLVQLRKFMRSIGLSCWREKCCCIKSCKNTPSCMLDFVKLRVYMCKLLLGTYVFACVFVDVLLFLQRQLSAAYRGYFFSTCVCRRVSFAWYHSLCAEEHGSEKQNALACSKHSGIKPRSLYSAISVTT